MVQVILCSNICNIFQYKATDVVFDGPGKFEISWTPEGGSETRTQVFQFKNGGGCGMAMYNTDEVSFSDIV
jgi:isocitrate dehydrogenase